MKYNGDLESTLLALHKICFPKFTSFSFQKRRESYNNVGKIQFELLSAEMWMYGKKGQIKRGEQATIHRTVYREGKGRTPRECQTAWQHKLRKLNSGLKHTNRLVPLFDQLTDFLINRSVAELIYWISVKQLKLHREVIITQAKRSSNQYTQCNTEKTLLFVIRTSPSSGEK